MNRVDTNRVSAGLCLDCEHRAVMRSDRGSVYLRCLRSASDPRFPKYPRLPVITCAGYAPAESAPAGYPPTTARNK
jgi:hypothetical protein